MRKILTVTLAFLIFLSVLAYIPSHLPSNLSNLIIPSIPEAHANPGTFGLTSTGSTSYPTSYVGDHSTGTGAGAAGYLHAKKFTLTAPATLTKIGVYSIAAGNVKVGLYADSAGYPGALLISPVASAVTANQYNDVSVGPYYLDAGSYWLATIFDTNGVMSYIAGGATGEYYHDNPPSGYPSPWPDPFYSGATGNADSWKLYGVTVAIKGYIKGTKATLTETATSFDKISFYSHSATGNVRLAIFDNASPKALIWESASTALSANAWVDVTITGVTNKAAGTYWLCWQYDNVASAPSYTAGSAGDGFYKAQAYGAYPSTISGETSSSEKWSVYITYSTNVAPTNGAGSITDMDDTNNLYAQKKLYTGSSVHNDADGWNDATKGINYVEFRIKQDAATRASFRYTVQTATFSTPTGSTEWTLDATSSASGSGTQLTMTWKFMAQWDAVEESGVEIELYVIDQGGLSDTDTAQTNYADVVTRLVTSGLTVDDSRVNVGATVTISGTVYYGNNPASNTASTSYPPDAEFTSVSIHNSAHATFATDTTIVNGAFSVSAAIPNTVQSNTYHVYINMADSDYTDADAVDGDTVAVIGDRIRIDSLSATDGRIDIGTQGEWYGTASLEYDGHVLGSGDSLSLGGYTFTWDAGQSRWEATDTKATVQAVTINTFTSGNEATYGITVGNINSKTATIIWDNIVVSNKGVTDSRTNINEYEQYWFTLRSQYDSTPIQSGTVTLNGTLSATWSATNSRWEYNTTKATVQTQALYVASINWDTYGITSLSSQTSNSTSIIWDRLEFVSVSVDDSRINVGGTFELRYQIRYDFDDVTFDSSKGSITGFVWDSVNSWWDKTVTGSSSVTSTNYDETYVSITDSTYGLTAKQDVSGVNVITDRIRIDTLSAVDSRVDINTQITFYATASLEYDGHALGSGDSFTLSGYAFSWDSADNRFETTETKSSVTSVTINAFDSGSEATYGITSGNINSKTVTGIWDRFEIVSIAANDTRINVESTFKLQYQIQYDYDDVTFDNTKGSILGFTWNATSSRWEKNVTGSSSVVFTNYDETYITISDSTYGLTVKQDVAGVNVITDRIRWDTISASATSISLGATAQLRVTASLEYDNHVIGLGDSLSIEGLALTWDSTDNRWEVYPDPQSTAQSITYDSISGSEATYGITTVNNNGKTITLTWSGVAAGGAIALSVLPLSTVEGTTTLFSISTSPTDLNCTVTYSGAGLSGTIYVQGNGTVTLTPSTYGNLVWTATYTGYTEGTTTVTVKSRTYLGGGGGVSPPVEEFALSMPTPENITTSPGQRIKVEVPIVWYGKYLYVTAINLTSSPELKCSLITKVPMDTTLIGGNIEFYLYVPDTTKVGIYNIHIDLTAVHEGKVYTQPKDIRVKVQKEVISVSWLDSTRTWLTQNPWIFLPIALIPAGVIVHIYRVSSEGRKKPSRKEKEKTLLQRIEKYFG